MDLEICSLEEIKAFNKEYDNTPYYERLSEATKYREDTMKYFIESIRPNYTYVDEWSEGEWRKIDIKECHSKYGINYIYIDDERKLWRDNETAGEFYNH